ncbi:MAG: 3-deoxy-D-manno-octulosonic acid transferase [Elusimicrobia bacterium]|nr:3-deoxy-D-manno-octulosonic acid transferase [Elusimicrobiota bacterium]
MLTLYSILFFFLWPLLFLVFVWRYGLRRTLRGLPERFGFGGVWPAPGGLWVHAASVGEVLAAENFLRALPSRFPGLPRLLTTTTVNGKELAQRLGIAETVRLAPLDRPGAVERVIARVRPKALVLVETEIWPFWLTTLSHHRIPVVVVNGRISDGAFPLYYRMRGAFSPLLSGLARVGVQSPAHAARYLQLGAHPEAVAITGNLKFEVPLPDLSRRSTLRAAYGYSENDLIWILGSTHPGEEAVALEAFASLREKHPTLRLIVAPRHVERAGEVVRLFADAGHRCALRSQRSVTTGPVDVLVLDTVGELAEIYGLATLVFVGGSLLRRGGQNPLEPARWGVPVVFGPRMENFREMAALFQKNQAGVEISTGAELKEITDELLVSSDRRAAMGEAARALADSQRGALEANLVLLQEALAIPPEKLHRSPRRCGKC